MAPARSVVASYTNRLSASCPALRQRGFRSLCPERFPASAGVSVTKLSTRSANWLKLLSNITLSPAPVYPAAAATALRSGGRVLPSIAPVPGRDYPRPPFHPNG